MVGTTEEICDPKRSSTGDALRFARHRIQENPSWDLQIVQFVNSQFLCRRVDINAIDRGLEILGAIASPGRLFGVLRNALSQNDPEIRSKAAMAVARYAENRSILDKLATDTDPRVRANTIEALWHRTTHEVEQVFLRALEDSHHRVAINAAYGLYLINPAKYLSQVEAFVNHSLAGHRLAAAWLIRRIGDARLLCLLKTLVRDEDAGVRRTAFRTLAALRSSTEAAQLLSRAKPA